MSEQTVTDVQMMQAESALIHHPQDDAVAQVLRKIAEQGRDPKVVATCEVYYGAVSRLDDGIGTHEEQARDQQTVKQFEASALAFAYDDYETACLNAEQGPHVVEFGHNPDGGYWWACTWEREGAWFNTEADAREDAERHDHVEEQG